VPLQTPGGPEIVVVVLALALNLLLLVGLLGGLGYFLLRIRSGGSVADRLGRIERAVGRLEARVERLETEAGIERPAREPSERGSEDGERGGD
jgi:hypothetical protein